MKTLMAVAVLLPVTLTLALGLATTAALVFVVNGVDPVGAVGTGGGAVSGVPVAMVRLYAGAAGTCPGLSWALPAAIGTVESGNGTSDAPGVHSGANPAGAEGPMQFEPATFAAYDQPVPPGGADPPSPYDPVDAVYAAVRMLCHDRAADPSAVEQAVWDYNHSSAYVSRVLALAAGYGYEGSAAAPAAVRAVDFALSQLGTPYEWGGETPGRGFDCSGLTQAAWAAAGVRIPRVAQDQFDVGPAVPATSPPAPGDLVFFGAGPRSVTHVGLVVGGRLMVDAPHTGADVRVEAFPAAVGGPWGGEIYVGATAPDPGGT